MVAPDPKMENIALGFDTSKPNENICELTVRLADCGSSMLCSIQDRFTWKNKPNSSIVTKPYSGEVTSLAYRSPGVNFRKPWSQSTDVWSWGIIVGTPD